MLTIGKSELKAISAICTNFSAVFLASLIIPAFTENFDFNNLPVLLLGLGFTLGSISLSLLFARKGKL